MYKKIGIIYSKLGMRIETLDYFSKSLHYCNNYYEEKNSRNLLDLCKKFAIKCSQAGWHDKAIYYYTEIIMNKKLKYGDDSVKLVNTFFKIALEYGEASDHKSSINWLEKCILLLSKSTAMNVKKIGTLYKKFGRKSIEWSRYDTAILFLTKAIEFKVVTFFKTHSEHINLHYKLVSESKIYNDEELGIQFENIDKSGYSYSPVDADLLKSAFKKIAILYENLADAYFRKGDQTKFENSKIESSKWRKLGVIYTNIYVNYFS